MPQFAELIKQSQIKPKPISERITEFTCKYTQSELSQFIALEKLEIADTKLLAYVRYFLNGFNNDESLFTMPLLGLCGCIGPINNNPECGCKMMKSVYNYRYHIALDILNRQLAIDGQHTLNLEENS